MTKENLKKAKSKKEEKKVDYVKKNLKKASDEVVEKVNWLKDKFDESDPATKKKIVAGLSAAAAGLVVLAGLNKRKEKK